MKKQELTQEILKELLDYNPDTGVFTWKERDVKWFKSQRACKSWNTRFSSKKVGSISKEKNGLARIRTNILSKKYLMHQLAYFYMTGKFSKEDIDCIDGDFTNLKWENIRECTRTDTIYKQINPKGKDNKLIGSRLDKRRGNYRSEIGVNGKTIHLGVFNTPEEAHQAYVDAKRKISVEFCML